MVFSWPNNAQQTEETPLLQGYSLKFTIYLPMQEDGTTSPSGSIGVNLDQAQGPGKNLTENLTKHTTPPNKHTPFPEFSLAAPLPTPAHLLWQDGWWGSTSAYFKLQGNTNGATSRNHTLIVRNLFQTLPGHQYPCDEGLAWVVISKEFNFACHTE